MNKQETLLDTIKNIPELIDIRLVNFKELKCQLSEFKTKRINIIASGTSYNAAKTIQTIAWKYYNMDLKVFYPNFFINNFAKKNFEPDVPYLFISQGGKTISTIKSIELVNSLGGLTISFTENLKTPIAEASSISIEIGSLNEKFMFRTAGYSLSVLTLYLVVLIFSSNNKSISDDELTNRLDDLFFLSAKINQAIEQAENWYKMNRYKLIDIDVIYIAGGSELISVAKEAEIKFMEMVPIQSNSFELEELIHGPQNVFNNKIAFFLLANNLYDFKKSFLINQFLKKEIKVFSQIITKKNISKSNEFVILDAETSELDPLIFITFIQVISYYLSIDRNRDLTVRLNASIDKYYNKIVKE